MHDVGLLFDLATVLGVAALTGWLFRRLGQPSILGYLAAGFLVGPYVPVPLFADPERIHALSELGVVLVMFAVGLELRLGRLFRVLPTAGVTALVEVLALVGCGMGLGSALGWSTTASLFLGASLSISSTMVVSKVFETQSVEGDVREHVMSVLVIQDVLAILLAAILTALAAGSALSAGEVADVVGRLVGVLVAIVVIGLLIVPRLLRAAVREASDELLILVCIGLCFGLAVLASSLGYSAALGAFFAGVLVAESGHGSRAEHLVQPLRDVFAAVFFVAVGMSVDPRLALAELDVSLLAFGMVLGIQLLSVSLTGLLSGNGVRRSITAGMALGQVGEFGFILSDIGVRAGVAPRSLGPIVVSVALLTAFSTPISLRNADRVSRAVYRALPPSAQHLLALYESWFDTLRQPRAQPGPPLLRSIVVVAIDGAVLVLLASAVGSALPALSGLARDLLGIGPPWGAVVISTLAAALGLFALVSLGRSTRHLGRHAAERVFGPASTAGEDPRARGRALFEVSVQSLVLLGVGVPSAVLAAPFVGRWFPLAVLFGMALELYRLWRSAGDYAPELRSSADKFVDLLMRQPAPSSVAAGAHGEVDTGLDLGLQLSQGVRLEGASHAVGRTLAQLDVRALTGATVVAIANAEGGHRLPTGAEALRSGDVLAMAGSTDSIDRARALLLTGELRESRASLPPPPPPSHREP